MSESVKTAQTLVWRASGGDADKTHPIRDSTGVEKFDSIVVRKRSLVAATLLGYHALTVYIESLIALPQVKTLRYQ